MDCGFDEHCQDWLIRQIRLAQSIGAHHARRHAQTVRSALSRLNKAGSVRPAGSRRYSAKSA